MEIGVARNEVNAAGGPGNVPWNEKRMLERVKEAINFSKDKNLKVDPVTIVNLGKNFFFRDMGAMKLFLNWTTVWSFVGLTKGTAADCRSIYYDYVFYRKDVEKILKRIDERYASPSLSQPFASFFQSHTDNTSDDNISVGYPSWMYHHNNNHHHDV